MDLSKHWSKHGILLSGVLSIFLLTSCSLFPEEEPLLAPPLMKPVEVSYSTVKAYQGNIAKIVRGMGTFVPVNQKYMFFQNRGGRIKDIHVQLGNTVKKGDLLASLYNDNIENEIKQQELILRKNQIAYQQVKDAGGSKYQRELAEIDIELAELRLNQLKKERDEAELVSDIDGVVVYIDSRMGPGDYVDIYQKIMRIADTKSLLLQYSGSFLTDFSMGSVVDVKLQGAEYKGKVVLTPGSVPLDGDESLKSVVRIEVEGLPDDVSMGQEAEITMVLEKRDNVVIVPKQAVKNYLGRKYVNILENGLNNERDVETGIENSTEVEIISGIEPGEEIILR